MVHSMRLAGAVFIAHFLLESTLVVHGFQLLSGRTPPRNAPTFRNAAHSLEKCDVQDTRHEPYNASVASQFKVLTCSASACAAKRKVLGMDEFATFSCFWIKAKESMPEISVEETACLGACKKAPCVGVEHEDFEGTVALDGMDSFEFSDRVFHKVIDQGDAERVWTCVENAVAFMASESTEE